MHQVEVFIAKQEGIQSAKIEADRIDKEVTKAVLFAEKLVALKLFGYEWSPQPVR